LRSGEMASHSGEWDAKKVDDAAAIGPEEWRPDLSDIVGPAARVATAEEVKAASKTGMPVTPAAPGYTGAARDAEARKAQGAAGRPGGAGTRFALAGPEHVAAERRAFRIAVAMLVLVVA